MAWQMLFMNGSITKSTVMTFVLKENGSKAVLSIMRFPAL